MRCKFAILILASGLAFSGYGQNTKNTQTFQQAWFGYLSQLRFSDKWGMWTDLHLRTKEDFFTDLSQSIVRVGATYYTSETSKLTLGYAWVNIFPGDNHQHISQPEHRIWQQLQWHTKYGKKNVMQWIRLEEKWKRKIQDNFNLAPGYNFNYKVRYNILYDIPLSKRGAMPGSYSFVLNDEVHVNFGKEIVYNYFDQNRFFAGFKYQLNKHDNLQFGYMNLFQQLAAGNSYKMIHAARVFYFQNLDLRKKNKK